MTFLCRDAERTDYRDLGPIDLVVANLCMSDRILHRAADVLAPDRTIAFAAFHHEQWKESGRVSRYAYGEADLEEVLGEAGFDPVYLEIEKEVLHFASQEEGLSCLESAGIAEKWRANGRWEGFLNYLNGGGRELTTRARILVKARRH